MEYSKRIMSIKEIHEETALPVTELKKACHARNQTFAKKTLGGGKWLIDTVEYERWRLRQQCT